MHFDIRCQRRVEPASVGRLIPPRGGIESPFLRTLAPGARLLLSHSDSMPSPSFNLRVTHRCSIRLPYQCGPGGIRRIARQSPLVIYPPNIRSASLPISKTRDSRAAPRRRRMRHPACAGITHPTPRKCHSIPQTESSVNPWKLRAARREQKVTPAKAVPLFAACHSSRKSVQRLPRPER